MNILRAEKYHLYFLLLLSLVLFFWKINVIPLTDGDSAFYAKVAKNIVQTGDWITMQYGDKGTIIDKPPLFMWMTAASFKVFGINDFAVAFWHSIMALLTVIFTYLLGKELYNARTAFISSLILITSAQFFYMARSPLLDVPLTLFVLLSIYCFVLYEKRGSLLRFYLSPVFVALAVLTKGPVGLVIPALVIILYIFFNRVKLPDIRHIIAAVILLLAITLPWFIAEYRILGQPYLDVLIGKNVGRYLKPVDTIGSEATKFGKIQPQYDFYSFLLQILILFIPWSGFFYPAVYYAIKKRESLLPGVFAFAVIIFFSLSLNYKISRYILPAFPAMALLTGKLISDLFDGDRTADRAAKMSALMALTIVVVPLLSLAFTYFYVRFTDVSGFYTPLIIPFLLPLCLAMLLGSMAHILGRHRTAFASISSLTIVSYLMLILTLAIYYPQINPIGRFCARINSVARPGDIVCQYKGTDAHFMIYYSDKEVLFLRNKDKMKELLGSGKKVYCIVEGQQYADEIINETRGRTKKLESSAQYSLITN